MTRKEWLGKRDALVAALVGVGRTAKEADELAVELLGVAPAPSRWDYVTDCDDVAVELSTVRGTVDVNVDGSCVFLAPTTAREMAAALTAVADHIDRSAVVA